MMRRSLIASLFLVFLFLSLSGLPANAQCPANPSDTLISIVVTAPGLSESLFSPGVFAIQSGSFTGLVATGTFNGESPCVLSNVIWSSDDAALISVSPSGLATSPVPAASNNVFVHIMATSGAVTSKPLTLTVVPQTALFLTDSTLLRIEDITLGEFVPMAVNGPAPISYRTTLAGGNGTSPVPMVLGTESTPSFSQGALTLLFVGNPAYQSNNTGDFTISVISTATHAVIATIAASDGLCYPTSLALKGNLLFVVNAGPAVFQASSAIPTAANCTAVTGQPSAPNVEVFDVSGLFNSNLNNGTFKPVTTFSASSLASSTAVPIVAAASIDPADTFVWIGSTANYNSACNNSCAGTLTKIDTSTSPPSVSSITPLSLSNGNSTVYSISPLGLTVATAYPSFSSTPTHTVFLVGPGFNTQLPAPNNTNSMLFWQFPDQCAQTPCTSTPQMIFPEPGPGYVPIPTAVAPDGLTAFAGDGGFFLDSFTSTDGSFFSLGKFFSTGGTNTCTSATCLPITAIATTSDNQSVYAFFSSTVFVQLWKLSPSSLTGTDVFAGALGGITPYVGLAITQLPEIGAVLTQAGTQITVNYTAHGNFQQQQNQTFFNESLTFNQNPNPIAHAGGPITNTSNFPLPQLIGNTAGSSGAVSHLVSAPNTVTNQSGLNSNGFIGTTPVAPISIAFQPASELASPASVAAGSTYQFSVTILNAIPDTATLTPSLGSLSLSSTSPGTAGAALASVPSGATVYYFAPTAINNINNPSPVTITAIPDIDPATCSSGTGNQCSSTYPLQIVAPIATLSQNSWAFPPQLVGTTSAVKSFTLTNTGSAALTISSVGPPSGTNANDFNVSNGCPTTLAVGAPSCSISVTFDPATGAETSRSAQFSIVDNASDSPQTVSLSGTAVLPPAVTLMPTSMNFGNQVINTPSAGVPVTLTNSGGSALTIAGSNNFNFTGANPSDFAQTNNCPSSLAAGAFCTINVTFTPSATGSRAAILNIADSAAGSPQTVSVSGNGVTPPAVTLAPTSVSFSNQVVNTTSAATPVKLTNSGGSALTIAGSNNFNFTGANPSDFAQTNNCPSSLAAGAFCTINVTFTPSATGSRAAILNIADNAAGSPQTVAVNGTGLTPQAVSLMPTTVTFGNQVVNTTSAVVPVTLTNTGGSALTFANTNSFTFTGANPGDFSQTNNCPSSLASNASCTIDINFTPTATGSRAAALNISDNAATSPQTLSVSGNGFAPAAVTLTPTTAGFGSQIINTTSSAVPLTLTNSGGSPLTIASANNFGFTGANPGDFAQTNNCPSSLASNASCTINIKFTPTATGARSATLNIADNAANSPQTVSLSGTGAPIKVTISPSSPQPIPTVTGGTIQFSDRVQGSTNQTVTWSVGGTGCSGSPCGTITSSGLYTAPAALPTIQPITDTVVATAQVDATQSASVTVSVSLASPVSVTVLPSTNTLNISTSAAPSTVQFSAKVQEVTNQSVTWQVDSIAAGNSTFGTITTTGLYTAPSTLPTPPAVTITAISAADPTKSGTATVTLVVPVTVTLTPASADVEVESGSSQLFTATVLPVIASPNVTWSLSGTGCSGSSCGSLTNITATTATYIPNLNATASSVVTIIATSVADGSKSASASINVFLKPVVSVSTPSATVVAGQPATYNFTLGPGTGDPGKPLTIQCDPRYLPNGVGCPSQMVQPSKTGVSFTVTLTTTGPQTASLISPGLRPMIAAYVGLAGLALQFGIVVLFKSKRRLSLSRRWAISAVVLVLLSTCFVAMNGCATNGTFGQQSPKNFNVTPNGTFTIHIDAVGPSGVPEEIGQVQLIVN